MKTWRSYKKNIYGAIGLLGLVMIYGTVGYMERHLSMTEWDITRLIIGAVMLYGGIRLTAEFTES